MLDGRGAFFSHGGRIRLQLPPVATRWGSRAVCSELSTFGQDGGTQCALPRGRGCFSCWLIWLWIGSVLWSPGALGLWGPRTRKLSPVSGFPLYWWTGVLGDPPSCVPAPAPSRPVQRSRFLGEGAKFSPTPFQLLRGGQQGVRPLSFDTVGL